MPDGVFSPDKGTQFVIEVIEPLRPIKKNAYWCDKKFHIDEIIYLY